MPASKGTDLIGLPSYDSLTRTQIASNLRRFLPAAVCRLHAFVMFKFAPPRKAGGKRAKLPFYVVGGKMRSGTHDTEQDRSHLVSFGEAVKLLEAEEKWSGIGVCALSANPIFFVDLDNCVDLNTGEINSLARELLKWKTYTEISPSGKGLRMIFAGNPGINGKNNKAGLELFCNKGFVTLTGQSFTKVRHRVMPATAKHLNRLRALLEMQPAEGIRQQDPLLSIPSPLTKERYLDAIQAMKHIDPDCGYDEWLRVGQALHSGDADPTGKGFNLWLRWSQKGSKFADTSEEEMARKWHGFHAGGGYTLASLFALAQQSGYQQRRQEYTEDDNDDNDVYTPKNIPQIDLHPLAEGLFDNYGAYMFIGRAKIGKSRILGSMVAAALCGGDALGFKFNKKCKVLALTLEEEPNTLLERIRAYSIEPNEHDGQLSIINDLLVVTAAKKQSDNKDYVEWLEAKLKKHKPDFVYIDTAVKLKMIWQNDPAYKSKNITEQDYQNASWLDQAAQRHRCVIVSVIHGSKRKGIPQHNFDPFESIGTTSWTLAGCTGALVLMDKPGSNPMEDEDDGMRVFSIRGRYMPRGDTHLSVQSNQNGTFTSLGEYHEVQVNIRTQSYLEFILEQQGTATDVNTTAEQIRTGLGNRVSVRTIHKYLRQFIESGVLYEEMRLEGVAHIGYRLVTPVRVRPRPTDTDFDPLS